MSRKDGYWSGWDDYRFALRRRKPSPIYRGKQRKAMIGLVVKMLRQWRQTPFENEAPARHALRSALTLKGHSWLDADAEAASLVAEGLKRLHVSRPTWEQGQRQYTIPKENCNWCARPLPDDMIGGNRKGRFCSAMCAKSALEQRDFETRWKESEVGRSAFEIIMRESLPEKECEQCGKSYRPFNSGSKNQRYCSFECSRKALTTIPVQSCATCGGPFRPRVAGRKYCCVECARSRPIEPRPCAHCQSVFVPKTEEGIYCSKSCTMRAGRARRLGPAYQERGTVVLKSCKCCGVVFPARSPKALFCDKGCLETHNKLTTGRRFPRYVSPKIFDYLVHHAPPSVVTPRVFDEVFAMAA